MAKMRVGAMPIKKYEDGVAIGIRREATVFETNEATRYFRACQERRRSNQISVPDQASDGREITITKTDEG